jgi:hypothetical protein
MGNYTPQISGFWQRDESNDVNKNFLGVHLSGKLGKGGGLSEWYS